MSKPELPSRYAPRLACALIALTAVAALSQPTLALATVTPKPGGGTLPAFLFVSVQKYGNKESVDNSSSNPANGEFMASSGITMWSGHEQYGWLTNSGSATVKSSGSITTNATGTAGSLDVTMVPVGTGETSGLTSKARGLLTVKGSWSTCAKSAAS